MGKKIKLTVKFMGFDKSPLEIEVDEKMTYSDLMLKFNINPETVLIIKDSMPVPLDEEIGERFGKFAEENNEVRENNKNEITVIRVISGG